MRFIFLFALLVFIQFTAVCQKGDFPFSQITFKELEMTSYARDTNAQAVVLKEYGFARINHEFKVIFQYHAKIKILKKGGLSTGDFVIPIYSNNSSDEDRWVSLQAVTFNLESNSIKESKFDTRNLMIERSSRYEKRVKFALPNVQVGSVIEVKYEIESPNLFQFTPWYFQGSIPIAYSEFWAQIPANFDYSIILRGFYKLKANTLERVANCFQIPGTSGASDCSLSKYVMEYVPAFSKEDFMTSDKNYKSGLHFELTEYTDQYGRAHKFSNDWEDVNKKLKLNDFFGLKIKKAKKHMETVTPLIVGQETDERKKAEMIYGYVKSWYVWNGEIEKYSDRDVKKAHEEKKGSSADINLALIGALQSVGLNANPVLVSTRENGFPSHLHAQQTDFDYVIAMVRIGDKKFLLDATDPLLNFGVLPIRCLNDQGRAVGEESEWVDLRTTLKKKTSTKVELKLDAQGHLKGKVNVEHFDYKAFDQVREYNRQSEKEYLSSLEQDWTGINIARYENQNLSDRSQPFVENFEIEIPLEDSTNQSMIYFNPFVTDVYESNPFKSKERLFPIDLGVPMEMSYAIDVEVSDKFEIDDIPRSSVLNLPQNGGSCVLYVTSNENKVTLNLTVTLTKAVYEPVDYRVIKEFFDRIISIQKSVFVFKKV